MRRLLLVLLISMGCSAPHWNTTPDLCAPGDVGAKTCDEHGEWECRVGRDGGTKFFLVPRDGGCH